MEALGPSHRTASLSSTEVASAGGGARARDRRIRLLHVLGTLGVGGAERQLLELSRRMNADRFAISVLCYSVGPDSLEQAFRDAGVEVEVFDKFSMPLWRFFRTLRSKIRQRQADIVHTWLYSANFWGRWAAVTCGVPSIIASHRSEAPFFHPAQLLTEWLLSRRTLRLANSMAICRSLRRVYGIPVNRTRIIHNAVELPECDRADARRAVRQELDLPPDHFIVIMVGRQTVEKNYPMFIRAAAKVAAQRRDVRFLGVGRPMMAEALEREVKACGAGDAVHLLPERSDVPRLLAAADVFCLTSDREGFPNAVLEAMCAGLPVICTAFDSAREVLPEALRNNIVPRNDETALAAKVLELLADPARRERDSRAGQEWVKLHFSWDRLVGEMESLYEGLVR